MSKDTSPLLPCPFCSLDPVPGHDLSWVFHTAKPSCFLSGFNIKKSAWQDRPAPASPSAPDVVEAAKTLISFGHPREGSDRYHAAWEALQAALSHNGERSNQATEAKIKELRTALKECRPLIEMLEDSSDEWSSKDCRRIMGLIDAALNGEPKDNGGRE